MRTVTEEDRGRRGNPREQPRPPSGPPVSTAAALCDLQGPRVCLGKPFGVGALMAESVNRSWERDPKTTPHRPEAAQRWPGTLGTEAAAEGLSSGSTSSTTVGARLCTEEFPCEVTPAGVCVKTHSWTLVWSPCGTHVVPCGMCVVLPCDTCVVCVWHPCGMHVACLWYSCGTCVVLMCYVCGTHTINKSVTKLACGGRSAQASAGWGWSLWPVCPGPTGCPCGGVG